MIFNIASSWGLQPLYDLNSNNITFEELYEKWSDEYFKKIAPSAKRTIVAARRYCSIIEKMKVKEIRTYHLKGCISNGFVIGNESQKKDYGFTVYKRKNKKGNNSF